MRITIEIDQGKAKVSTDKLDKELDEDRQAEADWFRNQIGHAWQYPDDHLLNDERGTYVVQHFHGGKLFVEEKPRNVQCVAYYRLPGKPTN